MSYLNYPEKYPTLLKYKEAQNIFNDKLSHYLSLEDKYNKLVEKQVNSAKWKVVHGELQNIVATGSTNIWGYNSSGARIFTCKKPCLDGKWESVGGSIKDIAGDKTDIYGIGMNNTLYTIPQNNSSGWKNMGNKQFDKITTNRSTSIIGNKNQFSVNLRITLKGSGEKDTYDVSVRTSLNNIALRMDDKTVYNQAVSMGVNNDPNSSTLTFNSKTTKINNIIFNVSNSKHNRNRGGFHFENPFKPSHVRYPYLSYLKIELLTASGSYDTLYASNINISTGGGNGSYGVSLGNGIKIGANLFQCTKPCPDNAWHHIDTDKEIQDISADESYIYMTDTNNILWRCAGTCGSGTWEKDPIGSAKKVDASGKTALRVIASDNMLWERDKNKWGQEWTPTNKVISNMSMSDTSSEHLLNEDIEGTLWTIEPNGNIEIALRPPYQKWRSEKNRNATIGLENVNKTSTGDWDFLGNFNNYKGCKFASLNAKRPYDKITYFNDAYNSPNLKNTCWGNKIGGAFKNKTDWNVKTGYPPYGMTQLGGMEGVALLHEMKKLNADLILRTKELERMTIPNNAIAQTMIKQKTAITKKMQAYAKNLESDRSKIILLEKQNQKLDGKKENSSLIMTQKQSAYIGIGILMAMLLVITAKQLKK
jgi:hypothetical protein